MQKLIAMFHRLTAPVRLTPEDGIRYWKEKLLLTLLLFNIGLILLIYPPSSYVLLQTEFPLHVLLHTIIILVVIFLYLRKDISYHLRAITAASLVYLLGTTITLRFGPFGMGTIWLFYFPLVVSLLLGARATAGAIFLNFLTLVAFGCIMQLQLDGKLGGKFFARWHFSHPDSMMAWTIMTLSFTLICSQAGIIIFLILNGLQNSLERLQRSEQTYRHVFENIMDIYFETDLEGKFTTLSPSVKYFTGYSPEELLRVSTGIFDHQPVNRKYFLQELYTKGHALEHEITIRDKEGRERTGSINARTVPGPDGLPSRITGVCRDITETKQMQLKRQELEERLNRSQKMEALGMLAGGVAHDLNNVLSGIVTYPELLLLETPKGSRLAKSLELIHAAGLRSTEIVQDLLTLSRRGVTHREPLDLNQLIAQFLDTPECKKILSPPPAIRVTTDLSARFSIIKGSSIHLQKTIMNLISNAAEAQPEGGGILISTANRFLDQPIKGYDHVQPGHYMVLAVEDAGTGISPQDIKRIFEPFFTKKVMGRSGTGLGMAVVWGTVQDHYGYIDVISAQGHGTRFDLYFPVSPDVTLPEPPPESLEIPKGNGELILVVDDLKSQREITANALRRLGYQVFTFDSGESVLHFLKRESAHLIILDMVMEPGIDGLQTYRNLIEFKPDQKVIIVSGFSKTGKVSKALALGVKRYIKKPYTLEEIGRAVHETLKKKN